MSLSDSIPLVLLLLFLLVSLGVSPAISLAQESGFYDPDETIYDRTENRRIIQEGQNSDDENTSARIVEIYPDSYLPDDAGEYIGVYFDEVNTSGWSLSDGEDTLLLPNTTLDGTVYFGSSEVKNESGTSPDYSLKLELANSGEIVKLRSPNRTVDRVEYGDNSLDVSEGEILLRRFEARSNKQDKIGWRKKVLGSTDFEYTVHPSSHVKTFVAPDSSAGTVKNVFESADDEILITAFEFDSEYLAHTLERAEERGVNVKILVEGSPPGGFEPDDARVLDTLEKAGVEVKVVEGKWERYSFLHSKYAVVDSRKVVVTSENWENDSMSPPTEGPRGWGVVIESREVARKLAQVFESDSNWRSVREWASGQGIETHSSENTNRGSDVTEEAETSIESRRFSTAKVGVVLAPDSSIEPVVDMIKSADQTVYVQQAYIREWEDGSNPYLGAVLERARSGVEVRVLLDSRWYVRDENKRMVERLNRIAEEENLNLEAKLSQFPVHNKGVVVDNESVLVSSINWNKNSVTRNREVGVVISDEGVASYFGRAFMTDWFYEGDEDKNGFEFFDHILELSIIVIVSGIGAWLVFFVLYRKNRNPEKEK